MTFGNHRLPHAAPTASRPLPALGLLLVGALVVVVSACGSGSPGAGSSGPSPTAGTETLPPGDIPDTVAYTTFSPSAGGYTIKIPEGFARADTGSTVVFTFHFNSITLQSVPAASAPTVTSAQTTDIAAIKRASPNATIGSISGVTRNAGTAVLIKYQGDSSPDPVTGKTGRLDVQRYEFWHNGNELIITLASPVGSDNVDPWMTVTNSLQWH